MESTLSMLREQLDARERNRSIGYRDLVRAVLDGEAPDADIVERILTEASKTVADLEADIAGLDRRRQLARQVDAAAGASDERRSIKNAWAEADRRLEVAKLAHSKTLWPLRQREQELQALTMAAAQAERELRMSALPGLLAEADALSHRLADLDAKRRDAQEKLSRCQLAVADRKDRAAKCGHEKQAAEYAAEGEAVEKRAALHAHAVAEFSEQMAAVNAESAALQAKMLQP